MTTMAAAKTETKKEEKKAKARSEDKKKKMEERQPMELKEKLRFIADNDFVRILAMLFESLNEILQSRQQ